MLDGVGLDAVYDSSSRFSSMALVDCCGGSSLLRSSSECRIRSSRWLDSLRLDCACNQTNHR